MRFLFLISFSFFLLSDLSSQSIQYSKKSYQIKANPASNSFRQLIHYKGVYPANKEEAINIYYGALDEIKALTIRYKNSKGKWKTLSKKRLLPVP